MKTWIVQLLVRWGLVKPRVTPKARKPRAKRKPAAAPLPRAPKPASKAPKSKPAPSHAATIKAELLNAVADALGRAPAELDPASPKATIAVNGSLYTVINTVDALSEFQSRLEKLETKVKPIGIGGRPLPTRQIRFAHNPP
jgi:hypothetical protein